MSLKQINKIENILHLDEDQEIVGHKITNLTAPGENYCSLMLQVDISVRTSKGIEKIHLVAKTPHPDERLQKYFNILETFHIEIGLYSNIVPTLRNFQKQHGVRDVVDFCPRYYGSRLDSEQDSNTVLLLENLKVKNFVTLKGTEGFDLTVAELVLTNLAQMHAVTLALRLQKREVFETEIKPYLAPWRMFRTLHFSTKQKIEEIINDLEEISSLKERILAGFDKKLVPPRYHEAFDTVIHNDCWVCNNMIKFEGGTPIEAKMVDFQRCTYGSFANDVVLFLFTSVKSHVLERYYDDLVRLYHERFTKILQELMCDITGYSFAEFEKEISFGAEYSQFGHILFLLFPIFAPIKSEDEEYTIEGLLEIEPTDLHKEKLVFVVKEFAKRNWI